MTMKMTTFAALLLASSTLSPLPLLAQDASGSQKIVPQSAQSEQRSTKDAASANGAEASRTDTQTQHSATADVNAQSNPQTKPQTDSANTGSVQPKPQPNQSAASSDNKSAADHAQSDPMTKSDKANSSSQADAKPKANNETADAQKQPIGSQDAARTDKQSGSRDQQSAQGAGQNSATDANRSSTAQSTMTNQTKINNTNSASADRPSNEITGSINISTEQKTEIRNVIVENKVETIKPTFSVSVGVAVPKTVKLHRLPPKVVEIVPQYRSYEYFVLADNRIVIVEPSTYEIVYVLVI
jgi:hypothetical protein